MSVYIYKVKKGGSVYYSGPSKAQAVMTAKNVKGKVYKVRTA